MTAGKPTSYAQGKTKIAHDHALPCEPLTPNHVTVAAMRELRLGKALPRANSIEELKAALHAPN